MQFFGGIACAASLHDLRCDAAAAPLAVENARPQLSWTYEGAGTPDSVQTSARIVVAYDRKAAEIGRGDVLDSGWVTTSDRCCATAGQLCNWAQPTGGA